jgi:hypothetical protein
VDALITGIAAGKARQVWPLVEPLLRRATARTRGRVSTAALLERIESGAMQLWIRVPVSAACLTEVIDYPHARWCRVVFLAGEDLAMCRSGIGLIEAWAGAQGCAGVEIEGRAGWQRVLPGYARDSVILRKEL